MAKVKFTANNKIEGLQDEPLQAGDDILLDPEDEATQSLIEAGALSRSVDLDEMTKAELISFAKDRHSVTLDGRLKREDLLAQVKAFEGEPADEKPKLDEVDLRIEELEAKGEAMTDEEKAELEVLKEKKG